MTISSKLLPQEKNILMFFAFQVWIPSATFKKKKTKTNNPHQKKNQQKTQKPQTLTNTNSGAKILSKIVSN